MKLFIWVWFLLLDTKFAIIPHPFSFWLNFILWLYPIILLLHKFTSKIGFSFDIFNILEIIETHFANSRPTWVGLSQHTFSEWGNWLLHFQFCHRFLGDLIINNRRIPKFHNFSIDFTYSTTSSQDPFVLLIFAFQLSAVCLVWLWHK